MYVQQRRWWTTGCLLALCLLSSLVSTACSTLWVQTTNPLPTLTVEPGWEIVVQRSGETTNQRQGNNQTFSLNQVSAQTYIRLVIACNGQGGSATLQTDAPFRALATATCAGTPQTVSTDLFVETSQEHLPVHLTVRGSVQWNVLIEKRT